MSPEPRATSPDVGAPPEVAPLAPVTTERPRRPWWRWLLVTLGVITLVVIALRLIAWVTIPIVLDRLAHSIGLDLQTRDVSLSLLGGEVELADVRAVARGGEPRVLEADFVRADLAVLPLLRGDVVLDRVEVEGVDVLLDRGLRDRVDFMRELDRVLRPLLGPEPKPARVADEEQAPDAPRDRPVRIDLPVEVRRLVVRHLRVGLRDPFVTPPVDVTAELTLELSGLEVAASKPTRVALTLEAPGVIEQLEARGLARLGRDRLEAALQVELEGVHPAPVRGWLDGLGVGIDHHTMALQAHAAVALRPALFDPNDMAASFTLDRLVVTGNGERVLAAERAHLELERLLGPGFHCRRLELVGAQGRVVRAERSLNVSGVSFPLPDDAEEDDDEPAGPVVLRDVVVRDVQGLYQDATVPGGLAIPVRLTHGRLRGASSRQPERPASVEVQVESPGIARDVVLRGDVWLFGPRRGAIAQVEARGVTLTGLRPTLAEAGLVPSLRDAELSAAVRVLITTPDGERDRDAVGWPVTVSAHVEKLRLVDDGVELVALDLLDAPALRVDPAQGRVLVEDVTLRGPRAVVRRGPRGVVHVGGMALQAGPAAPSVPGDADADGDPDPAAQLLRWRLQVLRLDLAGVQATWIDQAPPGGGDPVVIPITEAGALVQNLDLELTPSDTQGPGGAPARVAAWVEMPGVIDRLEVHGTADAGRGQVSIALEVDGRGVTLDSLRPYLAQAGIEPTLQAGRLMADVEADATRTPEGLVAGAGALLTAQLLDGDRPLLLVNGLRADGARVQLGPASAPVYGVEQLSLRELELPVRLAADGAVTALGLRFGRAAPAGDVDPLDRSGQVRFDGPLVPLPRVEVGGVSVERATLRIQDERRPDPEADLPVVLELVAGPLDFDPTLPIAGAPTPVLLRLEAPGAVDVMSLRGEVALAPDLVRLEALVTAHGLTDRFVSSIPGLHTQDMVIDEGHARLRAAAILYRTGDVLAGRASVGAASLVDRTGELAGLDLARVDGFTIGPAGLRCTDVDVRGPRLRVVRGPDGLRVAGLWLPTEGDGPDAPVKPTPGGGLALPDLPLLLLDDVRLTGLRVDWTDLATTPMVAQQVEADLVAHAVSTIPGAPPGVVRLVARAPGAVDRLVVGGRAWVHQSACAVGLAVEASGVRGPGLAAYLPGLEVQDGLARATVEVQAHELPDGNGLAARVQVRDLFARDGERLLASVPLVALDAPRIDPARRIEVARLVAEVQQLDVVRTADGLSFGGVPVGGQDADVDADPPASSTARIGAPPPTVTRPLVRCGVIDLQVAALRLVDGATGRVVLVGRDLHLRNLGPFEVLGQPGRERPRPGFELTGGVAPLARAVRLRVAGDPLALDPRLDVELEASGLDGERLPEVAPALADRLDAAGLVDGALRAALVLELRTRRSDPLDFSFVERGFGGRVDLTGLDLRDGGPSGRRLVAVDQVLVDVDRFAPGTGRLEVRLAEVFRPRFTLVRVPEGWRIAGVLFKPGPEEPEEPEQPDATEVFVRQLFLTGLEATYRDRTVSPPFVVPLRGVELQVTGLDLAALQGRRTSPRPLTFSLLAFSNLVQVPERPARGLSRLTGVVSTIVGAISGRDRGVGYEAVPLFQELSARGAIDPGPDPTGRVRLALRGLELRGLIGLAAQSGVDLSDGVADLDAVINLGPEGEADAQVGAVFKDLSLTEPRDGPLQRLLKLPATLDTLLFVLRDDRGRIRLSVDAEVPPDGQLERGEILGAVLEALGEQLARALRSAPLRILSPIVSLVELVVGDIMGWRERHLGEPLAITFAPGSADLNPAAWAALGRLAKRLEAEERLSLLLRHELGTQDEADLATITRPGATHDRALVVRLLRQREQLLARRSDLEVRVRTLFAAGRYDQAQAAVAAAQRLEYDLGRLQRSLSAAEDRLGSRIDRFRDQRARAAARLLADARLRAVRQALCAAGAGPAAARRVRLGPGQYFAAPETARGSVIATPQLQLVEQEELIDILEEDDRPELGGPPP